MARRNDTGKRIVSTVWRSIDDVIAHVTEITKGPCPAGHWRGMDRDRYFFGSENWEEMVEVVQRGWPEGAARVKELVAECDGIVSEVRAKMQTVEFDVMGQWLDVGRYLTGEPEVFGEMVETQQDAGSKIVRIEVNLATSAHFKPDQFFARGAAACVLADLIEASGRRCELYGVLRHVDSYGGKIDLRVRVLVKAAHEPLDMNRLAAAFAHASFYRRALFSLCNEQGQNLGACYPEPFKMEGAPPEQIEEFGADGAPGVIRIQEMHSGRMGGNDFKEFMVQKLREAGIKIDDSVFEGANN